MNWARSICTLTVGGLLAQSSLCSWSNSTVSSTPSTYMKNNYPFSQDQGWYTEESYLLWKPSMENMWYGNKATFEVENASTTEHSVKVKDPDYEWSSGFRVALGRYLPNHDGWDASLTATYLYSNADNETKADPFHRNIGFNSSYSFNNVGNANEGNVVWRLNYWTADLSVGRLFLMTPTIVFHPYLGLRGSWQYQKVHSKVFSRDDRNPLSVTTVAARFKIDNEFWGVGPRFGTNFIFYFENHFSFLANLSTSLLVGNQKLSNNQEKTTTTTSAIEVNSRSRDRLSVIRSNLEGMVGLGWETWLKNNTVRVAPSVCLEGSLWFAMNQLYNIYPTTNVFDNIEQRRTGNLGLMGLSFNLQVDF